ncbi:MAG: PEGA domain-containing protein [Myxococcales bacterium]|nr:MAG: PEGA domain-containing protein [Myxococcales bacterium]
MVKVDGQAVVPSSSGGVQLKEGNYVLEVGAEGYTPERREIAVQGGQSTDVVVALQQGSAETDLDGSEDALRTDESEGSSGSLELTTPVLISGGVTLALLAGTIVTGLVAVSADNEFEDKLLQSRDTSLSNREREQAAADGRDAADRANTFATVSDVLLVGTLIGAGVTTFLLFSGSGEKEDSAPSSEEQAKLAAAPYVSPREAGFVLKGSF